MLRPGSHIAVLGGGFQGACVALELASRGMRVDLYERNAQCLTEASLHNQGKIHLGFVYAHDKSFASARLMAQGALAFERALQRWIGAGVAGLAAPSRFAYAIHKDSFLTPDAFEAHCRKVSGFIREASNGKGAPYFSSDILQEPGRMSRAEIAAEYSKENIIGGIRTPEVAVDPEDLARLVRTRLDAEPAISVLTGRIVEGVKPAGAQLAVLSSENGALAEGAYDFVVNTLWTGRLALDAQLGLKPNIPWLFRFKYFVRAKAEPPQLLRSTTIALGPFGDIVNFGGAVYLSWYPAGISARSKDLTPPPMPSVLSGKKAADVCAAIVKGLSGIVPDLAKVSLSEAEVRGGWVFAWGQTDIDDRASELHRRSAAGVHRHGPYLSIDTGNLTLAPLFAEQAVRFMAL